MGGSLCTVLLKSAGWYARASRDRCRERPPQRRMIASEHGIGAHFIQCGRIRKIDYARIPSHCADPLLGRARLGQTPCIQLRGFSLGTWYRMWTSANCASKGFEGAGRGLCAR